MSLQPSSLVLVDHQTLYHRQPVPNPTEYLVTLGYSYLGINLDADSATLADHLLGTSLIVTAVDLEPNTLGKP
jgi:hypothetical protein